VSEVPLYRAAQFYLGKIDSVEIDAIPSLHFMPKIACTPVSRRLRVLGARFWISGIEF